METKSFAIETKFEDTQEGIGSFAGYASTFGNIDSYNDIIEKGAFRESVEHFSGLSVLWQHNTRDVIGVIKTMREDDIGLYVEGILANTTLAKDARELMKIGAIKKMSIGFIVKEKDYDKDKNRILKSIDLKEVSLVTFPANDKAQVTSVKGEQPITQEHLEKRLREVEFNANVLKITNDIKEILKCLKS